MSDGPTSDFPACLQVSPSAIKIDVELNVDKYVDLRLQNVTDSHVAFKIKTTARDRYLLRPTQDILKPREEKLCKIVMSAMSSYPDATNPKNVKDKFLIQSLPIEDRLVKEDGFDLSKFWKSKESEHNPKESVFAYHEERIKCKLNIPASKRAEQASNKGAEEVREAENDQDKVQSGHENGGESSRLNSSVAQSPGAPSAAAAIGMQSPGAPAIQFSLPNSSTSPSNSASASSSASVLPPSSSSASSSSSVPSSAGASSSGQSDLSSDFERSTADRKRRDYNELMDFVVKLTAQMEREKVESANIADKYQKALQTIAQLQKKNAQLLALQNSSGEAGASGSGSSEGKDGENPRARELRQRTQEAAAAVREANAQDQKASASGMGITQIIIVALIAFILGKLFA